MFVLLCLCLSLSFFVLICVVSKSLLPPENVERFINFLCPNASRNAASTINFKDDLSNLNVKSIGLFGNKKQICQILVKFGFADKVLYVLIFCEIL